MPLPKPNINDLDDPSKVILKPPPPEEEKKGEIVEPDKKPGGTGGPKPGTPTERKSIWSGLELNDLTKFVTASEAKPK